MFAKFFASSLLFVAAVSGAAQPEKRQNIGSIINSVTSDVGSIVSDVTSGAESVGTQVASGATGIFETVTSAGGHAVTVVTSAGGEAFTLATNGVGEVTSIGGSIYTIATSSPTSNAGTRMVAQPAGLPITLVAGMATVVGGFLFGAWSAF